MIPRGIVRSLSHSSPRGPAVASAVTPCRAALWAAGLACLGRVGRPLGQLASPVLAGRQLVLLLFLLHWRVQLSRNICRKCRRPRPRPSPFLPQFPPSSLAHFAGAAHSVSPFAQPRQAHDSFVPLSRPLPCVRAGVPTPSCFACPPPPSLRKEDDGVTGSLTL